MSEIHHSSSWIDKQMEQPQELVAEDAEAIPKVVCDKPDHMGTGINNNGGYCQRVAQNNIHKIYAQLAMKDGQILELRNMLCLAQKSTIEANVALELMKQGRTKSIDLTSGNNEDTTEENANHHHVKEEAPHDLKFVHIQMHEVREKCFCLIEKLEAEKNNGKKRQVELTSLKGKLSEFENKFNDVKNIMNDKEKMIAGLMEEISKLRNDRIIADESQNFEMMKSSKMEGNETFVISETDNSSNHLFAEKIKILTDENINLKKKVKELIIEIDAARVKIMRNEFLQVEIEELEEMCDALRRKLDAENKNKQIPLQEKNLQSKSKEKNGSNGEHAVFKKKKDKRTAVKDPYSSEKEFKKIHITMEKSCDLEEEKSIISEESQLFGAMNSNGQHLSNTGLKEIDAPNQAENKLSKGNQRILTMEALEEENISFQNQLSDLQYKQTNFNLALSEIEEDKSDLEHKNDQLLQDVVELKRKNSEIKSALILANLAKTEIEEKLEVLEGQTSKEHQLQAKITELLSEVDIARGQVMKKEFLEVEVAELKDKCASLKKALQESQLSQQSTEEQLTELQAEIRQSKEEYSIAKLEELDEENFSLKSEFKELQLTQHTFTLALSEMEEDKSDLEHKNDQLLQDVVELKRKNSEIKSALILANLAKTEMKEKLEVLEGQTSKEHQLQAKITELLSEVDIARGQVMKKEFLEVEVAELKDKCARLKQSLEESQSNQQGAGAESIELPTELQQPSEIDQTPFEELKEENLLLKNKLKELQQEENNSNLSLCQLEEDKFNLERINDQLRNDILRTRDIKYEIETALWAANQDKAELEEKLEIMAEELGETQASMKTNEISMMKLDAQVHDLKKKKEELEKINHSLRDKYEMLKKDNKLAKENSESKSNIEKCETYIEQLETSLKDSNKICSQLKADTKEYKVRIMQLEEERMEVDKEFELIDEEREKWSQKFKEAWVAADKAEDKIQFIFSQLQLMTNIEMPMGEQNEMVAVNSIRDYLCEKDSRILELDAANREMQDKIKELKDKMKTESNQLLLKSDVMMHQSGCFDQDHQSNKKLPEERSEIVNDECDALKKKIQYLFEKNRMLKDEIEKVYSERSQYKKTLKEASDSVKEATVTGTSLDGSNLNSKNAPKQELNSYYDEEYIVVDSEEIQVTEKRMPGLSLDDISEETEDELKAVNDAVEFRFRNDNEQKTALSFSRTDIFPKRKETGMKVLPPSLKLRHIKKQDKYCFAKIQIEAANTTARPKKRITVPVTKMV